MLKKFTKTLAFCENLLYNEYNIKAMESSKALNR